MLTREIYFPEDADITVEDAINAEENAERRVVQEELDACLQEADLGEDFDMSEFEECMGKPAVAQYLVALLKSLARANVTLTDIGKLLQEIEKKLK